jgi:L,D-peptidoglycan transpeptidase YkuD (ErfK/YbiS/YcfS/YnhG family)
MLEKNISKVNKPFILVDRKNYSLELYSDTLLVKKYNAVFGKNGSSFKITSKDFVTPTGSFKICRIDTNFIYYKKLYLNYPNIQNAAEALRLEIISREEYLAITNSLEMNNCPFENTPLGAEIGIQGIGEYNIIFKNLPFVFNWTNGSIAISNENIDELLSVVDIGTNVKIVN